MIKEILFLVGVEEAKVVLNIVAIIVSLNIAFRSCREMNRKEVVKISGFMLIGMSVGIYLSGRVTGKMLGLTGACVIPVFVAIIIGSALHKRIRQDVFVKLTYALLVISGITLLT